MKIVTEEPDPIPDSYSPELRELLSKLLCKDQKQRPSAAEILKMDYVRERMQQFVEQAEFNN